MSNRVTPFIKRMRAQGGTIYTFSSATEDIGISINERDNIVKLSNYALLNIPKINTTTDTCVNLFNVQAISGAYKYQSDSASVKDGRLLIAESFQNYALNFETEILEDDNYDATLLTTVSERIFWKWLKETGAIRWEYDSSTGYWKEELDADGVLGYNTIVKGIGEITAGNMRTDTFGTYNETYVLVPTSYGQGAVYFKQIEDNNYYHGMQLEGESTIISGRSTYGFLHPDGLSLYSYFDYFDSSTILTSDVSMNYYDTSTASWLNGWWFTAEGITPVGGDKWFYFVDTSSYLDTSIFNTELKYTSGTAAKEFSFRRSNVDCMSIVTDIDELKIIFNDTTLTYDTMNNTNAINDNFEFNAVLIYYTVYNSTGDTALATNLLGILFLDNPTGTTANIGGDGIEIPSLEKLQSNVTGFGTSYSFRLNIKTDSLLDDTAASIFDEATSAQNTLQDFSGVFNALEDSISILQQQGANINYITTQYNTIASSQAQILSDVTSLSQTVNNISKEIDGTEYNIPMFDIGGNGITDSSMVWYNGNLGVFTLLPEYDVEINSDLKVNDIIIEKSVRDTSGNVIISYGSPIQVGASTNSVDINFYCGSTNSFLKVSTDSYVYATNGFKCPSSNNAYFRASDVSTGTGKNLYLYAGASSTGNGGIAYLYSGNSYSGNSGAINIYSGTSTTSGSGAITIAQGSGYSSIGDIQIGGTYRTTGANIRSANLTLYGVSTSDGGWAALAGGTTNTGTGTGGSVQIKSGRSVYAQSGHIYIFGGDDKTSGDYGKIYLQTGSNNNFTEQTVLPCASTNYPAKPALTFNGHYDFGFYWNPDVSAISIATDGSENFRFDASTLLVRGPVLSSQDPMPSDLRLKTNIVPLYDSLDIINSLNGIEYTYKSNNKVQYGLIAQDVEKILPKIVDEYHLFESDATGIKYKTIRYTELIPYLIESIKELTAIVNKQGKEIENLKNK